jgi:hypothetical protein
VQFLKKQDSGSGPKPVVNKHRLTFGLPLVLVFFFRKIFSKNLCSEEKSVNSTAIFRFFRETKTKFSDLFFEKKFAHISTVLLVW